MKVYIHKTADHECSNVNAFIALDGFRQPGWEICSFQDTHELYNATPDEVVAGRIRDIRGALANFNINIPPPLDYPPVLQPFLGRQLWRSTLHTFAKEAGKQPVFIKPFERTKSFTGNKVPA